MNRFEFCQFSLLNEETIVSQDKHIKLYDGDEKVIFLKFLVRFRLKI